MNKWIYKLPNWVINLVVIYIVSCTILANSLQYNHDIPNNYYNSDNTFRSLHKTRVTGRRLQSATIDDKTDENELVESRQVDILDNGKKVNLKTEKFCRITFTVAGTYLVETYDGNIMFTTQQPNTGFYFISPKMIKCKTREICARVTISWKEDLVDIDTIQKFSDPLALPFYAYAMFGNKNERIYKSKVDANCKAQRWKSTEDNKVDFEMTMTDNSKKKEPVVLQEELTNDNYIQRHVLPGHSLSLKRTDILSKGAQWFLFSCNNKNDKLSHSLDNILSNNGWFQFIVRSRATDTFTAANLQHDGSSTDYFCALTNVHGGNTIQVKQGDNIIVNNKQIKASQMETFTINKNSDLSITNANTMDEAHLKIRCKSQNTQCSFEFKDNVLIETKFLDVFHDVVVIEKGVGLKARAREGQSIAQNSAKGAQKKTQDLLTEFRSKATDNYAEGIITKKTQNADGTCLYNVYIPTFNIEKQLPEYIFDPINDQISENSIQFSGSFNSFTLYEMKNKKWQRMGDVDRTAAISSNPMFDFANNDDFSRWLIKFYAKESIENNIPGNGERLMHDLDEMYMTMRTEKDTHLFNYDYKIMKVFQTNEENFHHQQLIFPLCTLDSSTYFDAFSVDSYIAQCKLGEKFYLKEDSATIGEFEERKYSVTAISNNNEDDQSITEIANLIKHDRAGSWDREWVLSFSDNFEEFRKILDVNRNQIIALMVGIILDERDEDYRGLRGIGKGLKGFTEQPVQKITGLLGGEVDAVEH